MTDITLERIEELRRLAEEATPGPWRSDRFNHTRVWAGAHGQKEVWPGRDDTADIERFMRGAQANAAYIAAANPSAMFALLDALEEAREESKRNYSEFYRVRNERDQLRAENERLRAALGDVYGTGHIAEFTLSGYGLAHPYECRKDGPHGLLDCPVDAAIRAAPSVPAPTLGRFYVSVDEDGQLVVGTQP